MAERAMQMGATQELSGAHHKEHGHANHECLQHQAGGLDTGARGWRFAYGQPAVRQMQASTTRRD